MIRSKIRTFHLQIRQHEHFAAKTRCLFHIRRTKNSCTVLKHYPLTPKPPNISCTEIALFFLFKDFIISHPWFLELGICVALIPSIQDPQGCLDQSINVASATSIDTVIFATKALLIEELHRIEPKNVPDQGHVKKLGYYVPMDENRAISICTKQQIELQNCVISLNRLH